MDVKKCKESKKFDLLFSKTIFISEAEFFFPFIKKKGVLPYHSLRKLSFFFRILRRIFKELRLPMHYWYGGWKHQLLKIDTVIVYSSAGASIVDYIISQNRNIRIIVWYWDPVFRTFSPDLIDRNFCEIWSFDKADCKIYNMRYNTVFYFDNILISHKSVVYDVCFIGYDKGRRKEIEKISQILAEAKYKAYLYVVDDDAAHRNYKGAYPRIPYEQILERIAESKAILDVVQDNQTGLTIRVMEGLFFKKKLITTQPSIKEYDFYHPDNVFILGLDNLEFLPTFLQKQYYEISEDIIKSYDFCNWINRFV